MRLVPIVLAAILGVLIGIGSYTFVYAKGYSYVTNDPAACANCHIMDEHYAAWTKSSHRSVAGCNDCHTPHETVGKYVTKARNGFWHSFYFTTGTYPYPLRITPGNREVTEGACRHCHEPLVASMDPEGEHGAAATGPDGGLAAHALRDDEPVSCIRCHRHVGHWVR